MVGLERPSELACPLRMDTDKNHLGIGCYRKSFHVLAFFRGGKEHSTNFGTGWSRKFFRPGEESPSTSRPLLGAWSRKSFRLFASFRCGTQQARDSLVPMVLPLVSLVGELRQKHNSREPSLSDRAGKHDGLVPKVLVVRVERNKHNFGRDALAPKVPACTDGALALCADITCMDGTTTSSGTSTAA